MEYRNNGTDSVFATRGSKGGFSTRTKLTGDLSSTTNPLLKDVEFVFVNGVNNDRAYAMGLGGYHVNQRKTFSLGENGQYGWGSKSCKSNGFVDKYILIYNPTHGTIGDVIESSFGKVFGTVGMWTGLIRGTKVDYAVAKLLSTRAKNNEKTTLVGHSQGAIIATNVLYVIRDDVGRWTQLTFQTHGPAANEFASALAVLSLGGQWAGGPSNPSDLVGNTIGFNNLIRTPGSIINSYKLAEGPSQSPHSIYPFISP